MEVLCAVACCYDLGDADSRARATRDGAGTGGER